MANMIKVLKSEKLKNRKLPFLPRVGLVVDAFGRQFIFKGVPFAETFFIARERGFSLATLRKVAEEQLSEVKLPTLSRVLSVVSSERAPVKKPQPKAAATPKKKAEKTEKSAKPAPEAEAATV